MATYKVLKFFTDMQDNGYAYRAGDEFPRQGLTVSAKRLKELASDKNARKTPLIEAVENASPVPEEAPVEPQTGENTTEDEEAKEKPRRGKKK